MNLRPLPFPAINQTPLMYRKPYSAQPNPKSTYRSTS
jgi:hypothetical protein